MKNIYLIGGTMGVGKTTTCQALKMKLKNSVFLDGDWCWDANPFLVTEETKKMVLDNICYVLNNFIRCSAYNHIILGWVMHEQSIIDSIISRLELSNCQSHVISLICSEKALRERLTKDVEAGIRLPDVIDRSIARIPFYEKLNTVKIDVSEIIPEKVADHIIDLMH